MNSKSKFAFSIAAILMLSGAAFADEVVQLGFAGSEGGPVSYVKRTPETPSVAVYQDRNGIAQPVGKKHRKLTTRPTGSFGENNSTSYYRTAR